MCNVKIDLTDGPDSGQIFWVNIANFAKFRGKKHNWQYFHFTQDHTLYIYYFDFTLDWKFSFNIYFYF